uniref:Jacalin-type lectin domain-containing protein n=1 Tax=Amphimedon queenslandica TaxID=400682 RepID=A0A1X7SVS0_AMPQE
MSMYQVDLLQLSYILANGSLYNSSCHGSNMLFYPDNFTLEKGEYVEKIEGSTSDSLVNQLTITLNQPSENSKRVIGPYGTTIGKKNFTFEGYIFAFHGRTGKYVLQNIGVYYIPPAKETAYFGLPSQNFKEEPDAMNPPVVKVSKVIIYHSDRINSLQLEYRLHGGERRLGRQYPKGPAKGVLTTLVFSDSEWLIGAYGKIRKGRSQSQIQISFVTRKADGSQSQYGPYGRAYNDDVISTTKFNMTGTIIGYRGHFNNGLNSVGFFYF